MRNKRIGNDIPFEWTILRNGKAENFNQVSVEVYLLHRFGGKCKIDYTIEGNVVHGIFRGKDQYKLGAYTLVLVENPDQRNMNTIDYVRCWELVPHTFLEQGEDPERLTTTPVTLASDITAPANGIGIKNIVTSASSEDEGINTITIILDDGEQFSFSVKNGSKGDAYIITDADKTDISTEVQANLNAFISALVAEMNTAIAQTNTAKDNTIAATTAANNAVTELVTFRSTVLQSVSTLETQALAAITESQANAQSAIAQTRTEALAAIANASHILAQAGDVDELLNDAHTIARDTENINKASKQINNESRALLEDDLKLKAEEIEQILARLALDPSITDGLLIPLGKVIEGLAAHTVTAAIERLKLKTDDTRKIVIMNPSKWAAIEADETKMIAFRRQYHDYILCVRENDVEEIEEEEEIHITIKDGMCEGDIEIKDGMVIVKAEIKDGLVIV